MHRHTVHQIRPGVTFHLYTPPDLHENPHGQLVADAGKRLSRKDRQFALARFRRCCFVRDALQRLEEGN